MKREIIIKPSDQILFSSKNSGQQGFLECREWLAKNPQWKECKIDEGGDFQVKWAGFASYKGGE